jgi:hypothetical protein
MLLRRFPEGERRSGVEETDWKKVLKLVNACRGFGKHGKCKEVHGSYGDDHREF